MTLKRSLILFLFICSILQAAETIAVNQLTSGSITIDEAVSLTNALRTELGKSGLYTVMERTQMEEILKEQGFQKSGACDEAGCAIEIGKLLSVKYIVLGNVGRVGGTYTVNVRMVDVGTGEIVKDVTEYHKGTLDMLLVRTIPVVVQKITGTYTGRDRKKAVIITSTVIGVIAAATIPAAIVLSNREEPPPENVNINSTW